MNHASYADIGSRLKRGAGHLWQVIDMIEQGAFCLDLAQRFRAVERAIFAAKTTLIQARIDPCLGQVAENGQSHADLLADLRQSARYR